MIRFGEDNQTPDSIYHTDVRIYCSMAKSTVQYGKCYQESVVDYHTRITVPRMVKSAIFFFFFFFGENIMYSLVLTDKSRRDD